MDSDMEKQSTINIGTIGHVAHGKSTTIRSISGKNTLKYRKELERNITIKLGYANAKIYDCGGCERPERYSVTPENCKACGNPKRLVRHISFVDCPGHEVLMATMLSGAAVMDAALLLIAANEECPQPQTKEHLFGVSIMNLEKILVLQNKIDLVSKEQAIENHTQIQKFLSVSNVKTPVIPISSQMNVNIDAVLDYLVNYIEVPSRNLCESPRMIIIRSFDINKPGTPFDEVTGGVLGGSLVTGCLRVNDEIEIRPGSVSRSKDGLNFIARPLVSRVKSLFSEDVNLTQAVPGGLIGVGTNLDPCSTKSDGLVGNIMGIRGHLPPVYHQIEISFELFEVNNEEFSQQILETDTLLFNISSTSTNVKIIEVTKNTGIFDLFYPSCTDIGDRLAISKKYDGKWRLIGHGKVVSGKQAIISYE